MVEDLTYIFYNYLYNGKMVDEYFIEYILKVIINEKKLQPYIRNIEICAGDLSGVGALASYSLINKTICVFMANIYETIISILYQSGSSNKIENYSLAFSLVMKTLFHELEHANQFKIMDEQDSMQASILKDCMKPIIDEISESGVVNSDMEYQLYLKNYITCPFERFADIAACEQINRVLNNMADLVPNTLEHEKQELLSALVKGYNKSIFKVDCPIKIYYVNTSKVTKLKKYAWYSNDSAMCLFKACETYGLDYRLRYGLPIKSIEYNSYQKKLKK